MQVETMSWTKEISWSASSARKLKEATLVIYFGNRAVLSSSECYNDLRSFYPKAEIIGCTTGGEIIGNEVSDDSVVAAAIQFHKTSIRTVCLPIKDAKDSYATGKQIAQALNHPDLSNIMVFSDGLHVNGSHLVSGITEHIPSHVILTGGLAGDGPHFKNTAVGLNEPPSSNKIAAIGFYSQHLYVRYGSVGGWDPFGPERLITRSEGNILYELDGKPALDLYKAYLGEEAERLPGSALLFPLTIHSKADPDHHIVRTIIGIDEENKSMIFAGDVPAGYVARLMRGNYDRLINGAADSAKNANIDSFEGDALAILISCIGRKLLMGQYISEEVEAACEIFNAPTATIGFYSYGEICPQGFTGKCDLHNQTMTITMLAEK